MPILFVSYSGLYGGAERILLDVLSGAGDPAVLACPEGGLAERAREAGVPVLSLPGRRIQARTSPRDRAAAPLRLAGHAREVRELATALGAPAVVAWGMRSALAAAAGLAGMRRPPRLVFEHVDLLPAGATARAVRAAARRADAVVCLSRAIADDLDPRGELGDRLHVVRPGVPVPGRLPAPPPEGPPGALVLGAIVDWKRPDLALDAVAAARREIPDLRAVLAGPAIGEHGEELLGRLRERASRPDLAGRVEIPGPLRDPGPALAAATCLLHAAEREPYGMVLAEALAAGRAVVAPAAGGPLEILDSDCGRIYRPGDASDAARALAEVVADPARAAEMGAAGWERAREHLRLEDSLERWRETALGPLRRGPGAPAREHAAPGAGIALVTVTHDSEQDLARLLDSVARHLPAAQVVVADSGSSDGSLEVARAWEGDAAVIDLGANEGYGRGSNRGVAAVESGRDVTVIVNPDVELLDSSLEEIARELRRPGGPERLLAPLVLHPDGRRQDSAQPAPATPSQLVRALVPPAALPGPLRRRIEPFRSDGPARVAWAVGCCVAAHTSTLRALGPFDERAFLYAEDLELGLRASEQGVETWFWPAARVVHREAHSSAREFGGEPHRLLAERRRAVVAQRLGPRRAALDDRLQTATFANRIALRRLLGRDAARQRAQLAAIRAARRAGPPGGEA